MNKEIEKKKTFTYYGTPSTRAKAAAKAEKEGMAFGELVDGLLNLYTKTKKGSLLAKQEKKTVIVFKGNKIQ